MPEMTGVSLSKEQFFYDLYSFIDQEAIQLKGEKNHLSYLELQILTGKVKLKVKKLCNIIPKQIYIACEFAAAIMAPTKKETIKILKNIAVHAGGIGGIALIIAALAPVLGWGAGFNAAILGFFAGIQVAPVIGQITAGSFKLLRS